MNSPSAEKGVVAPQTCLGDFDTGYCVMACAFRPLRLLTSLESTSPRLKGGAFNLCHFGKLLPLQQCHIKPIIATFRGVDFLFFYHGEVFTFFRG